MQQHGSKYFAHRHTINPGGRVKSSNHFFLKVDMLHIKLKEIPQPLRLGQKVKYVYFSESGNVEYQIKSERSVDQHAS